MGKDRTWIAFPKGGNYPRLAGAAWKTMCRVAGAWAVARGGRMAEPKLARLVDPKRSGGT